MSTDFQQARKALGRQLRELRGQRTQRNLAGLLDWPQAKVSKLETGRQTATMNDVTAWAEAVGAPETATELTARLQGLDHTRSWRRQLRAYGPKAFAGNGQRRADEVRVAELERKVGRQALEIDFLRRCLQHVEEQRKLQALDTRTSSTRTLKSK